MYDLSNMLLDSVCQNFVKDFCIYVHSVILACSFFVCVASLSGFDIRAMVASQNEFGSLPSSAIFWKSLSLSLRIFGKIHLKPSGPGLLFVGRFLITVSISELVMCLLRFSISSWFSFGRLYSSKNSSISSIVSTLLVWLLIVVSYDHLYFCVVCCDFSIFISNFVDLILLPFSLMSLANGLSILFIFPKNQL